MPNSCESKLNSGDVSLKTIFEISKSRMHLYCETFVLYLLFTRSSSFENHYYLFLTEDGDFNYNRLDEVVYSLVSYFGGIDQGRFSDKIAKNAETNELGFNTWGLKTELEIIEQNKMVLYGALKNRIKFINFYFFYHSLVDMNKKLYSEDYGKIINVLKTFFENKNWIPENDGDKTKSTRESVFSLLDKFFGRNLNKLLNRKSKVVDITSRRLGESLSG